MKTIGIFIFVLLLLGLVAVIPFGFIWSINTLFGLGILYTSKTWIASLVLLILFYANKSDSIKIKEQEEKKSCCRAK